MGMLGSVESVILVHARLHNLHYPTGSDWACTRHGITKYYFLFCTKTSAKWSWSRPRSSDWNRISPLCPWIESHDDQAIWWKTFQQNYGKIYYDLLRCTMYPLYLIISISQTLVYRPYPTTTPYPKSLSKSSLLSSFLITFNPSPFDNIYFIIYFLHLSRYVN